MQTDYILFFYWVLLNTYTIVLGAVYLVLYVQFTWSLVFVSWFICAMIAWLSYKTKRRIEYNCEGRLLTNISEKLREVKENG